MAGLDLQAPWFIALAMDQTFLAGAALRVARSDFGDEPAWADSKTAYVVKRARGKEVLDLGCVMHDPEAYRSRYWLHRAIREVAATTVGLDLYEPGVRFLQQRGFDVIHGDAQAFHLGREFDVIVAGDLIEHLSNFEGFLLSCKRHLRPGGVLVIQTPNPWFWKNVAKAVLFKEVPNNPEHTCWFDPRTLRQLVRRFGMAVDNVEFQSRYARDRFMPLPSGIRHAAWSAEVKEAASAGARVEAAFLSSEPQS